MKKMLAGAPLALLLATQLCGCGASSGVKPSEATCNQFLQLVQAKQFTPAYGLLSSQIQASSTQQQIQTAWSMAEKRYGKIQSWSQTGFRFYSGTNGNYVNLAYSLKCSRSTPSIRFSCVEENNKWLIQSIKTQ